MAKFQPLRGSYWEQYPVPDNEARCFARRTLHEAFGGNPTLSAPAAKPRRSVPWALAMLAVTVAALTVLGYGCTH
jgi:hypothetical protein